MTNNYFEFLKLIFKKNSLLRVLQICECLDINLSGISLELGAISNRNKTFSNFVMGKSKFHYSNKVCNKRKNIYLKFRKIIK